MATRPPARPVSRSRADTTPAEPASPAAGPSNAQPASTRLSRPEIPVRTSSRHLGPAPRASVPLPAEPARNEDAERLRHELGLRLDRTRVPFRNLTTSAMAGLAPAEVHRLIAMVPGFASNRRVADIARQAFTVASFLGGTRGKAYEPYAAHFEAEGAQFMASLEDARHALFLQGADVGHDFRESWYALAARVPQHSLAAIVEKLVSSHPQGHHIVLPGLARAIGEMSPQRLAQPQERAALDRLVQLWLDMELAPPDKPDFVPALARLQPVQFDPVIDRLFDKDEPAFNQRHQRGELLAVSHRLTAGQFDQLAAMLAPAEHRLPPFFHARSLLTLPESLAQMDPQLMHERREPLFRMIDTLRNVAWFTGDADFVASHAKSVAEMDRAHVSHAHLSRPDVPVRSSSRAFASAPPSEGVPPPAAMSPAVPMDWPTEIRHAIYQHLEPGLRDLHVLRRTDRAVGADIVSRYPASDIAQAFRVLDRTVDLAPDAPKRLPSLRAFFTAGQAGIAGSPVDERAEAGHLLRQLGEAQAGTPILFDKLTEEAMAGLQPEAFQRLVAAVVEAPGPTDPARAAQAFAVAGFVGRMDAAAFEPHSAYFDAQAHAFVECLEAADRVGRPGAAQPSDRFIDIMFSLAGRLPGKTLASAVRRVHDADREQWSVALPHLALAIRGMKPEQLAQQKSSVDAAVHMWLLAPERQGCPPIFIPALAQLRPEQHDTVIDRLFHRDEADGPTKHRRGQVVAVLDRLTRPQFDRLAAMLAPVEHRRPPFHHAHSLLLLPEALARMDPQMLNERREPLFRMIDTLRNVAWFTGDLAFVESHARSVGEMARAHVTRPPAATG